MVVQAGIRVGEPPVDPEADLTALRDELLEPFLTVPVGAALYFLFVQFDGVRLESWLPVLAFAGVALAAFLVRRANRTLSAILLAAGLFVALTTTLTIYPDPALLSMFAVAVATACVLRGPWFGLGGAVASTVALLMLPRVRAGTSPEMAGAAVFLTWAVALLTWVATRPAYTALSWAWYSAFFPPVNSTRKPMLTPRAWRPSRRPP